MFLNSNDPKDHEKLVVLINEWNPQLYKLQNITTALQKRLKDLYNDSLQTSLATLYTYDKQYDKALTIYLRLKKVQGQKNLFQLIREHNLFDSVRDKVRLVMDYDQEQAIELFINNTDRIPIEQVVAQLQDDPKLLHKYLHALFQKDPHIGKDFHELQVKLYAQFDYPLLLPFLKQSMFFNFYNDICVYYYVFKTFNN